MSVEEDNFQPKVSIRTILIFIFIFFSVVPLGVVTVYSVYQYKRAIDQENYQKLRSRFSELQRILETKQLSLESSVNRRSDDKRLQYFLVNKLYEETLRAAGSNLIINEDHMVDIYQRTGELFIRLKRDSSGDVQISDRASFSGFRAPQDFLKRFSKNEDEDTFRYFDFKKNELVFTIFKKILTDRGRLVGYLQESISLSKKELEDFKERSGLVAIFTDSSWSRIYSSKYNVLPILSNDRTLLRQKPKHFGELVKKDKGYSQYFVSGEPIGLFVRDYQWGEDSVVVGVGSSVANSMAIIENVNRAFMFIVLTVTAFLFLMWWLLTKKILAPIDDLVEKIHMMKNEKEFEPIEDHSNTELGLVTRTFNTMSDQVLSTQRMLRGNITELEHANRTIKSTQSQLIHTAKMASLGQLVAGVAHELNNPISFISSNMLPLREYFQAILLLVETAEKDPEKLKKLKKDVDFEFIKKDLPKVIESCEEGANRTHSIVLGLRSFSRLGEAELKRVSLAENIDNTLQILAPQLKGRVEIVKNFESVPQVMCFPGQLNQVFMNIISNGAQAIEGEGTIRIKLLKYTDQQVEISIEDSGRGMEDETMEKIFDPFFTTKQQGEGTGLGLSISFGIIEKHNGQLIVESQLNKGSKFIIRLPIDGPQ